MEINKREAEIHSDHVGEEAILVMLLICKLSAHLGPSMMDLTQSTSLK